MRKVAVALVVVVVIAVLATPLVGGILARRAHAVLVQSLPQVEASSMGAVRVADEGFELGWLSSKARMRLEVGPAGSSWTFPLVHVVHHGPLPVAHAPRGFSAAIIDTTIDGATLPDGKVPFRGETVIGMTGDLGVDLESLALPRRETVAWEGGTAQIRVNDQGARIALQANAPRFELHGADSDVVFESVQLDYTTQRKVDGPSTGSASYALGRARIASAERNLAVEGFSWKSSSDLNSAGKLDSSFALRVAGFDLDDLTYRNVSLDLALKNLDEAATQALSDLGRQLGQIAGGAQQPEQMANQIEAMLMFQLPRLLGSSPELELRGAHVETLDGPIDAELRLTRDPSGSGPGAVQVEARIVLPLQLFAALTMRAAEQVVATGRLDSDAQTRALIADQIAEQALRRGYVKEEDDGRLSSAISYRKDELALNGQRFNLSELILSGGVTPQ